jgi:hypothetical protein
MEVERMRGRPNRQITMLAFIDPTVFTTNRAQNTSKRCSAIDGRAPRHPGYAVSRSIRKRVEEIFGWMNPACQDFIRG